MRFDAGRDVVVARGELDVDVAAVSTWGSGMRFPTKDMATDNGAGGLSPLFWFGISGTFPVQ